MSTQDGMLRIADAVAPSLNQLLDVAASHADRPYYNDAADAPDRDAYYASLPASGELYDELSSLLRRTHHTELPYQPATHLYPLVDRRPDGGIISLYSGEEFDVQELIREDFRRQQELERRVEVLRTMIPLTAESLTSRIESLEAQFAYNCEHVVPQSWFNKRLPMRGDLHHLFACEIKCNSFRGNTPYYDFTPDNPGGPMKACGRSEPGRFEPRLGKSAAARATLYFLLRYPGEINQSTGEYTAERLATVLSWAKADPVSDWERHRNASIFAVQGNRNPLIDHLEWIERIDFTRGLGS